MSSKITYFLMVFYVAILIASIRERNWPRVLYWLGALILTLGVVRMGATK